jgi:hypothetical protein
MSEPTDRTLALLRRMDAKLDRLQSDVTNPRSRLQRVEDRLTSLDARFGSWRPSAARRYPHQLANS